MERGDSFLRSRYFSLVARSLGNRNVVCVALPFSRGGRSLVLAYLLGSVLFFAEPHAVCGLRGVLYFRSLAALGCGGSVCSFSDFRGRIRIGEERAALRSISDRNFVSSFLFLFLLGFCLLFLGGDLFFEG